MNPIKIILFEIFNLGPRAESIILQALEERRTLNSYITGITNEIKQNIFSMLKCCLYYESEAICRFGKYNKKQRYSRNNCNPTFTDFTNSLSYNSKKPLNLWVH